MLKRRNSIWLLVTVLLVLVLVLPSCAGETTTTTTTSAATSATTSAATTSAAGGDWWDSLGAPQYGGTLNVQLNNDYGKFDPGGPTNLWGWYECLLQPDWTVDPDDFNFETFWIPPDYLSSCLIKEWEWTGSGVLTATIQEGIKWQDKAPSFGRDFTAEDIYEHYCQAIGVGDYADVGPNDNIVGDLAELENIVLVDESTVEFHFKSDNAYLNLLTVAMQSMSNAVQNPDVRAEDPEDWTLQCGTGPLMLTSYTSGVGATLSANPDYWQNDPRYPDNQWPYVDEVEVYIISDESAIATAIRTGQVDYVTGISWQQTQALEQTNPDLERAVQINQGGSGLIMRVQNEPFDDIKVRTAMQMAIDYESIADVYYNGAVASVPNGIVNEAYTGWGIPFDDWPEDLQAQYTYDLDAAKSLLAETDYPDGFETNVVIESSKKELAELLQDMLAELGIVMEIDAYDRTSFGGQRTETDQMLMSSYCESINSPVRMVNTWKTGNKDNFCDNNDAAYDALVDTFMDSATLEEAKENFQACNEYFLESHWILMVPSEAVYTIYQPYIGGFTGQNTTYMGMEALWWSRFWLTE